MNDYFREQGIIHYYINISNKEEEEKLMHIFEDYYNLTFYKNNKLPTIFVNIESLENFLKLNLKCDNKFLFINKDDKNILIYEDTIKNIFTNDSEVKKYIESLNLACTIIQNEFEKIENIQIQEKNMAEKYKKYPYLFHKYILGIAKPDDPIKYDIIKENNDDNFLNNKLWAHLHCFDIDKFDEYYGEYIEEIIKYYSVIVTFSNGANIPKNNITILKIPNKGMDVGAKFCAVNYLNKMNINYDFIMMLHSKSNKQKRNAYFKPYLKDIKNIVDNLNGEYGIYSFHNLCCGSTSFYNGVNFNYNFRKFKNWGRNSIYMDEIVKYLNLADFHYIFPEGNVYILNKDIANYIYYDKFEFYNCFNYDNSFDYQWVKTYYNIDENDINNIHKKYVLNKFNGNNYATNRGWRGLADCMTEHIFERIIFGICLKLEKKIYILESDQKFNNLFNNFMISGNFNSLILPVTIIACHTNSEMKYNALINNINYLKKISSKIIIINSNEFKGKIEQIINKNNFILNDEISSIQAQKYLDNNPDLIEADLSINSAKSHWKNSGKYENRVIHECYNIDILYQENDKSVCQGKWYNYLTKSIEKYESYILTNDSFIITRNLDDFQELFSTKNYEMVGILDSYEGKYHYPDFLRYYNEIGIKKIINYYEKNLKNNNYFIDAINTEIESTYITDNKECLYKMDKKYIKNIHFDDQMNKKYLEEFNYPIIKLKKLSFTNYDVFPDDFDPIIYRKLHPDLHHLKTNDDLLIHFKKNGMSEGRPYKKNQKLIVSGYLQKYLNLLAD